MAILHGKPSQYLFKSWRKYDLLAFCAAIVFLLIMLIFVRGCGKSLTVCIMVYVLLPILIFYIIKQLLKKSDKYYQGGEGESAVGFELEKLPDDFYVFRSLIIENYGGNLDFVVLGPTGLFVLEVKSHSGEIDFGGTELTINGHIFPEKDILKQAMHEALSLHEFLKTKSGKDFFIQPVIIFSGHVKMSFGLKPINNVFVVGKSFLNELITSRPQNFSREQIFKIENELKGLVEG